MPNPVLTHSKSDRCFYCFNDEEWEAASREVATQNLTIHWQTPKSFCPFIDGNA